MSGRSRSLSQAVTIRTILLVLALFVLMAVVSGYYIWRWNGELDRSLESLSKTIGYAVAPAFKANNVAVIHLIRDELKKNQGVDVLFVTLDGLDMLTLSRVEPDVLARYPERVAINYFSGFSPPEQLGWIHLRRNSDFLREYLIMLGLVVTFSIVIVWFMVQRFLAREVISPLHGLVTAIERYGKDNFREFSPPSLVPNRELATLVTTVERMDETLQDSRRSLERETEQRARERFEQESRRQVIRGIFHDVNGYVNKIATPARLIRMKVGPAAEVPGELKSFLARQCDTLEETAEWMRQNVDIVRPIVESPDGPVFPVRDEEFDVPGVIKEVARAMRRSSKRPG